MGLPGVRENQRHQYLLNYVDKTGGGRSSARSAFARFRKGRACPAPFKALVREQGFIPTAASTYRSAVTRACDLDAGSWERFDA